jgi:hypothetical protein
MHGEGDATEQDARRRNGDVHWLVRLVAGAVVVGLGLVYATGLTYYAAVSDGVAASEQDAGNRFSLGIMLVYLGIVLPSVGAIGYGVVVYVARQGVSRGLAASHIAMAVGILPVLPIIL